ncbi:MAG TPA: ABC-F family ATP-binding cassette domain-containing protein [Jatrophihabitans sp.]|nr:ABC-F family ATP-binding cassette domain-containing protein [Jatrophihabitans sp.]
MIIATDVELRAGARILLQPSTLRVQPGDRIGLVGRNGAGKTTMLRTFAGETLPHAGRIDRSGPVGYLPQDPRTGDLDVLARDRVLSARGLDTLVTDIAKTQVALAERPDDAGLLRRYGALEERFTALGGYAAESEAARICANLGLPDRVLNQPLRTLSGGQRRRVELARIIFGGSGAGSGTEPTTLLLDEPTNHLDADSIVWLRDFLRQHTGGLLVISHDIELVDAVVNKVWYLDANRSVLDVYNVGWKTYLQQRESDERRRHRERANAERKIEALRSQADKMRAKATKARAAHQMDRRAAALAAGLAEVRVNDKVARLRFPAPASCGRTPLTAEGLSKSYGSLEVFADVDLAVDRGARVVVLGLNGAGKTTLLRLLSGLEQPDTGEVRPGHGLRLGYYAQEHETLDHDRSVLENMRTAASSVGRADLSDTELRKILGAFLFSGDDVNKPAGVLSGGEKTRLALAMLVTSAANVLLLDEPTNNLDPVSRQQVLDALRNYSGAIVLVTHDEGAVEALNPEKVILLPDGIEDSWNPDLADLITLA